MPAIRLRNALAIVLLLAACTSSFTLSPTTTPSAIETTAVTTSTIAAPTQTSAPRLFPPRGSFRPETTTRSSYPPGDYWWDPVSIVWLHNPTENDAGVATGVGVAIFITSSPASEDQPEPMPGHVAVVAGYEGTYRKQSVGPPTGARDEVWVVGIEGTMITIAVSAETGVTEAELAEAHAIVESIRTEPWETQAGFRMIFTLPPGWDSA